ncbi:MAG: tetratricopeptide repeat protein [Sandaracinaceae bacterium]|nr:tetratricopeptide repeat protein [Sandaracinaceae bacterium]
MTVDRTKVLEAAQKHYAKGNYDKAIAEYVKIVQADPSDVRTWLKIGDIYTRKGARKEAIDTYARVAKQYGDQGFFLKAVAVYKQILKLDPSRLDIQLKLAEMYESLQLISDALNTYEHVAATHARAGNIDEALKTLARMADLDPENIPVRIKYAEALSKAGKTKEAADAFEAGAKLLRAAGRMDDYIKVAERLCFHRPTDVAAARELASLYLERADPKRALAKLQACFKADPKDIATLELLAEAFNQLQQLPKTISVYKEVARIHQEANRKDERARILKKILELDPGDGEARQGLAAYAGTSGSVRRDIAPPASAVVHASEAPEPEIVAAGAEEEYVDEEEEVEAQVEEEVEEEVEVLEDEDDLIEVEEAVAPVRGSPSVPPDIQREAQIARLLTECDVFLRYGLKQKVIEQLKAVLAIDPAHVEARERLKDMFVDQRDYPAAINQLIALAEVFESERSAAAVIYLRQALELDPSHAGVKERLARLGGASPSSPPPQESLQPVEAPPPDAAEPTPPEDEVFFVEEETANIPLDVAEEAAADATPGLDEEPEPSLTTATDAPAYGEPAELEPPTAMRPALVPPASEPSEVPVASFAVPPPSQKIVVPPPSQKIAVPPPSRELSLLPSEPPADPLAPMSPREFDEVPLRPSQAPEAAPPRRSIGPGEIEEVLDEADFFIAQGLYEEARGILRDALASHPTHPIVQDKYREVEELATEAAAQRSSTSTSLDQSFELAEKLAEGFDEGSVDEEAGADILDVEEVFAQFKKGVEQQVGLEDTETHFDLGIAYKEMGLLDDAANEFRLCLSNPQRVCIAETMIGLCHIEKGEVAEAISHFKKGLYADNKTDREELGLYFELGNAYQLLHDPKEAIYYYQKVQKRDPVFRDVGKRIQGLTAPVAPAPAAPAMGLDDIDRAFDDLVGED